MALPMPPKVSPVDSVKLEAMRPNPTNPYGRQRGLLGQLDSSRVLVLT
jgi:hypothetical protein